jgi:hypothetical protein
MGSKTLRSVLSGIGWPIPNRRPKATGVANQNKRPALEKASRTGHPNFRILTQSGRMGVVLELRAEIVLGNAKGGPPARDNIIYLAVGLGIAALVVADFFYADSHGRKMWMPSRFAFSLVTTTPLLAYFVITETRKAKATFFQAMACVLFASVVHLAIGFGFQQTVANLSGLSYSAWTVLEIFILVQLLVWVVQHLRSA